MERSRPINQTGTVEGGEGRNVLANEKTRTGEGTFAEGGDGVGVETRKAGTELVSSG